MQLESTPAALRRLAWPLATASLLAALVLSLAACGGSSGGTSDGTGGDTPPPVGASDNPEVLSEQRTELAALPADEPVAAGAVPVQMPQRSAVRFLNQASFGAVDADIDAVRRGWRWGWMQAQFAMPITQTHWDRVRTVQDAWLAEDPARTADKLPAQVWDWSVWQAYLSADDALRKRVGYALSQILVVSMEGLSGGGGRTPLLAAGYLDVLERNAFGNYRQLLEEVTLNPAMGMYLSHRGNRKAEYDAQGKPVRVPDENYAREVMQLFTIGLVELNADGTPRLVNGKTVDSYTQDDVTNLARVFTGWDWRRAVDVGDERLRLPMSHTAANHSPEEKKFLGVTIAAGTDGPTSLRIALDTLFNHPNVGPFIARQLIQRLVTSNPKPDYVKRVADRFADNGKGVRGDLRAVLDQVLRDPQARSPLNIVAPAADWGKLREPVLRFSTLARSLGIASSGPIWRIGNLSDPATGLGQSPLRSPSVFNFYRPGYVPPNTPIAGAGLVAPEFQITTDTSVPGIVNALQRFMASPPAGITLDYTRWISLADNPVALAARLDLDLANGALGTTTRREIVDTLTALPVGTDAQRLNRVRTALLMVMAAPDFSVQK